MILVIGWNWRRGWEILFPFPFFVLLQPVVYNMWTLVCPFGWFLLIELPFTCRKINLQGEVNGLSFEPLNIVFAQTMSCCVMGIQL